MVNNYISIIGVIFSTIVRCAALLAILSSLSPLNLQWCSSDIWKGEHNSKATLTFGINTQDLPATVFPQSIITFSAIAPNVNNSPANWPMPQSLAQAHMHASQGHRPHPFANIAPPYDEADRDDKDSESGSVNLARTIMGDEADAFLQSLRGPVPQPHANPAANETSLSPSPMTPIDLSIDLGGNREKNDLGWEPAVAPPRRDYRPERQRRETSPDTADMNIELNFATPSPPQSDHSWWHHRPRSRSRTPSDSPDYDARGTLCHPRDLDIADIPVTQDDSDTQLHSFGWHARYRHVFMEDPRLRRPIVDAGPGASLIALEADRPLPSRTPAHRSSFTDWSEADAGGHTPAS